MLYFRVQQDFDKISLWMIQMGFTLALFYLLLLFSKEKFVLSKKFCVSPVTVLMAIRMTDVGVAIFSLIL